MKLRCRQLYAKAYFLLLTSLLTTAAVAQLNTSVGGALSDPLDLNTNGLDSAVAPIPSSSIEAGANNLLTPEERALTYDGIGASLVATPLTPLVYLTSVQTRNPSQLDSALRDATIITGVHNALPANLVDVIARKSIGVSSSMFSQSGWSKTGAGTSIGSPSLGLGSGAMPTSALLQQSSKAIEQGSSWRVGGSSPALAAITTAHQPQVVQQPDQNKKSSQKVFGIQNQRKGAKSSASSAMQATTKERDYSKSPLEIQLNEDEASTGRTASIFDDFNNKSFLAPDITRIRSQRKSSKETSQLDNRRTAFGVSQTSDRFETKRSARNETRSLKKLSNEEQVQKARWHNPILQQDANSSTRR